MVARRLVIHGLVQGVYYRSSLRRVAVANGLVGWVHNRSDGNVQAFVQGPRETVDRLVEWCHEGPSAARVERVDVEDAPLDARLTGFGIV
jgi:acylphosphatase